MRTTFFVEFRAVVAKWDVVCAFKVVADIADKENTVHVRQVSERVPAKHVHFRLYLASDDSCGNPA